MTDEQKINRVVLSLDREIKNCYDVPPNRECTRELTNRIFYSEKLGYLNICTFHISGISSDFRNWKEV